VNLKQTGRKVELQLN